MKLIWCLTIVLLVVGRSSAQNWYDEEEEEEDHIDEDIGNVSNMDDEDRPDIICEKDRMCTCSAGVKGAKDPSVVDCVNAKLKNSQLETANLQISKSTNPNFKAEIVKLNNNAIDVLRWSMIMPEQEANVLSLDFSHNHIEMVERLSFDRFTKLLKLKLTHNRLRNYEISDDWLTKTLGSHLHQLHLDYNYITKLDDGIFDNLVNLTKLVLDGNSGLVLTAKTFGPGLQKLKTLSLDNCGLTALDDEVFTNLKSLTQLSLSGNKFSTIPTALSKVPKLSALALSENQLTEIPKSAFKDNAKLKTIYLRKMPLLREVKGCAFCGMTNLEVLDLSNSKHLAKIDESAFGRFVRKETPAKKVNTLLLDHCALTSVSENLLDWEQVDKFSVHGNPLICDCVNMQWLMKNEQGVKMMAKPTCAGPDNLKGLTLKEASKQACGAKTSSSNEKMTLVVVLVGLCASIFIVGFFYARSKGGIRHFLPSGRPESPQLGYSNLTARGGPAAAHDDDENRLDEDFNRPEFV